MLLIDGRSFDDYIVTKSYDINEAPEYGNSEYRDGWWKKHRDILKHTVTGTVTFAFPSATVYNDFVEHLNDHIGAEGDHTLTLYVNNLNDEKTIQAYVTFTTRTAFSTPAFGQAPVFWALTMNIEER